ncbi:MAG: non-ribosomal peptide synthetase, partial [Acidimicrobiales bacterium]
MEISSPDAAATVGAPDPARGWPQGWNETTSDYERDSTIDDLVRARAQERPDAIAIVDGDATVTYVELVERADALAARVRPHLDGPDQCVGVVAERSSDAVVAFLGVLAAGAAFVPLEAGQPVERLRAMVRDTHARATVAPSHLLSRASEMGDLPVIELRDERAAEVEAPPWSRGGGALAYVMFTSGSTGRPKGVGAEHRGVLRYVRGARDLAPTVDDAVLHVGSIGFDASTYEIWGALCNGARLVVHPESRFDPREVAETITRHGVTVGMFSAGSLHLMVDGALASLGGYRLVISAGDVLSPAHAARLRQEWPATRLVNAYGPTEATVTASVFEVTSVTAGHSVPIGHPLANTTLYVLDGDRLVAPGEVGELCVGGEGVARGYVGLPELTAERFVADPFGPSGGRLYRTGDLVRLDGEELEFLGRRDDQVKIRGYLVEPAEVVAALSGCDGVAEAEVVSIETIPGHRRLVAYVTSDGRSEIDAARLRRDLARRLPDYLVPSRLEVVDALPQTELGKHDRAALAARARSALGHDPSAGAEALVAACWCAVLEVSDPGADDDFFESGGDSLLALALTAALDDACGVNLPLHVVFDERTIARLARRLDVGVVARDLPTIVARDESDDRRASMTQAQACFVADLADDALPYQSSASVSLEGPLVVDALVRALNALVARHDVLRARLPLEWGQRLLVVDDDATAALDAVDLSREPDADVAADVETTRRFRERIDPAVGPLVRWTLLTLAPGRHRLLQVEHHVAHDGWSFALLMGELVSLYRTEVAGLPSSLSPLTLSYADFAVWQNGFVDTDEGAAQAAYWRDELSRVAAPPSV